MELENEYFSNDELDDFEQIDDIDMAKTEPKKTYDKTSLLFIKLLNGYLEFIVEKKKKKLKFDNILQKLEEKKVLTKIETSNGSLLYRVESEDGPLTLIQINQTRRGIFLSLLIEKLPISSQSQFFPKNIKKEFWSHFLSKKEELILELAKAYRAGLPEVWTRVFKKVMGYKNNAYDSEKLTEEGILFLDSDNRRKISPNVLKLEKLIQEKIKIGKRPLTNTEKLIVALAQDAQNNPKDLVCLGKVFKNVFKKERGGGIGRCLLKWGILEKVGEGIWRVTPKGKEIAEELKSFSEENL